MWIQDFPFSEERLNMTKSTAEKHKTPPIPIETMHRGCPYNKKKMPSEITPYFSFQKEQSCQERRVFGVLLVLMNWGKRSLTVYTAPIMVWRHACVPIEGCRLCLLVRDECTNQDLWSQLWFKSREIPRYSTGDLCRAKVIQRVMLRKKEKRGKPHGNSEAQTALNV